MTIPGSARSYETEAGGIAFFDGVTFGSMDLTTGQDPFATLGGVTIAGVSAPTWTPPVTAGDVIIGEDATDLIHVLGEGGLVIDASGDITLQRTHISFSYNQNTDARNFVQPFDLTAGGSVTVQQLENVGPISVTAGDDITFNTRIGAHVAVVLADTDLWNIDNLAPASVDLLAMNGDINFWGARAVGDINIDAPNGQVVFGDALSGVVSSGGSVSVTDSDTVTPPVSFDPAIVARLPKPTGLLPVAPPGPTLAGPAAPTLAGAQPPGAPAGATVAALGAPGGATLAGISATGATVTDVSASGAIVSGVSAFGATLSGPSTDGATVAGTSAPGGATSLSEVFVEDPVVSTLTLSEIIPSDEADEAGDDDSETGQSAAQGEDDDEDDEKDESAAEDEEQAIVVPGGAGTVENPITYDSFTGVELVFTGGRGQAQTEFLQ